MANLVVSALAEWNGKALKKGTKDISAFDKSAKKLGKTLAKTFAGYKLLQFGKASVNAFVQSEKAAGQLKTTVDNLGLSFQQPAISQYIKNLELQYGIVDENLIPGFQRLLIATKDVSQAQSVFDTALNVSAATGKDLTTVSTVLAKAYMGDTTALAKLGVGLSKAQLKAGKFVDIQSELNTVFAGQARKAASGYVGDMAKVTIAVDNAKEAIGKGLLDALSALSGSNDINVFTSKMVAAAEKIGSAFRGIAGFIDTLIPGRVIKVDGKFVRKSGIMKQNVGGYSGIPSATRNAENKAIKDIIALRKQEVTALKAKTAVDQLKDKFDLERIGLMAALNAATDDETKLRLKAQLAILDNNEALARKYLAEMNGKKAIDELATAANNAANALGGILRLLGIGGDQGPTRAAEAASVNYPSTLAFNAAGAMMPTSGRSIEDQNPNNLINVTVNANNLIDPNQLAPIIQDTILRINRAGNQIQSTGGL